MKNCVILLICLSIVQVACVLAQSSLGQVTLPLIASKRKAKVKVPSFSFKGKSVTIDDLQRDASDEYIEKVVDCIAGCTGGDIIRKYKPSRFWLWRRWKGTIFQHGIPKAAILMAISAYACSVLSRMTGGGLWMISGKVDGNNVIIQQLKVFERLWKYNLTLTTFILTFFLSQAFGFWRGMYDQGRNVQGRLNDISLLLAAHAKRNPNGTYTRESEALLDEISVYLRLFSPFLWASQARSFRVLLTERGMKSMVARGLLSQNHMETLLGLDVPRNQLHNACLEWILIRILKAQHGGLLMGGESFSRTILEKCCDLRGAGAKPGHSVSGRMPLVYAHFVQVLVDSFLFGAPLALFVELGSMSVICVGMLTLFYEGLLDLAKVFLDPLENEDYCDGGIEMDLAVLIRESNAATISWKNAAANLPFRR